MKKLWLLAAGALGALAYKLLGGDDKDDDGWHRGISG